MLSSSKESECEEGEFVWNDHNVRLNRNVHIQVVCWWYGWYVFTWVFSTDLFMLFVWIGYENHLLISLLWDCIFSKLLASSLWRKWFRSQFFSRSSALYPFRTTKFIGFDWYRTIRSTSFQKRLKKRLVWDVWLDTAWGRLETTSVFVLIYFFSFCISFFDKTFVVMVNLRSAVLIH